jgi:hypothetical protein
MIRGGVLTAVTIGVALTAGLALHNFDIAVQDIAAAMAVIASIGH